MRFMEDLLTIAAEAEHLIGAKDGSAQQALTKELSKIMEEVEHLYGPRDRSYKLLEPLITECSYPNTRIYRPLGMIRIYLTMECKRARYIASYQLAHEAVHTLSPVPMGFASTILEEGVAEFFAYRYVNRVHGLTLEVGDSRYDSALRASARLLAENEFVIKELRLREPIIAKMDPKLLVEVAGVDSYLAEFLCRKFDDYQPTPWRESLAEDAQRFIRGFRSIWE